MKVSIIVAMGYNRVIGFQNKLPWPRLPSDMHRFKEITTGHAVIMGRKTYESIGHPLQQRTNIVISRNLNLVIDGCIVVHSIKQALDYAEAQNEREAIVIGGAEIYKAALSYATLIYLTRIQGIFEGDAFFPELSEKWGLVEGTFQSHRPDKQHRYSMIFSTYQRM